MSEFGPEAVKNPKEIERKYLVTTLPENVQEYPREHIHQGYVAIGEDGTEVRLRDSDGTYTQTYKSKGDLARTEREVTLSPEQFDILWPATAGKRVQKTRFSIPYNDATIELDIYKGPLDGLVTAEVEFASEMAADLFVAPEWFDTEVTLDKTYKNQTLALKGLPI